MSVLALDTGYQPLQCISWERAFVLLAEGKVEVEREYEDRFVRTVKTTYKMPAVVRFLKHMRTHKRAVKFSRQNVYARDNKRCQYCGNKVPRDQATYDHIIPRAQGGQTRWENIVIACYDCNQRKRNRTPVEAGMKLLTKPVKPSAVPGANEFYVTFKKDWKERVPKEWLDYLRDVAYWETALEEDE